MTRQPLRPVLCALALWGAVSCLDISSPVPGIGSISRVLSPAPSVVVGDSARDSTDSVEPLRVVAFAPNGDTVRDAKVEFFVLDSTRGLVVDSNAIARGLRVSPGARVVARVTSPKGGASLQTDTLSLPVVPVPQSLTQAVRAETLHFNFSTSDTLTGNLSGALGVSLRGNADTVIPRYIVRYTIDEQPAGTSGPLVVLANSSGHDSTVAITDASGAADRRLRLRLRAADAAVLAGSDSVIVKASARVRGQEVGGSPVTFVVYLKP